MPTASVYLTFFLSNPANCHIRSANWESTVKDDNNKEQEKALYKCLDNKLKNVGRIRKQRIFKVNNILIKKQKKLWKI